MTTCAHCDGHGFTIGYGCPGFRPVKMKCGQCGGDGLLTDEDVERIHRGKEMRRKRIARDLSLREQAKRLGVSVIELSNLERGIKPK